jgi:hypothetical protein
MTDTTGTVAEEPKGATKTPPEEQFWRRYSPHHEFPLSSSAATAIHIAGIVLVGLLLLTAGIIWKENKPPEMTAVTLGDDAVPGAVGADGRDSSPQRKEAVPNPTEPKKTVPDVALKELPVGDVDPITLPMIKGEDGDRLISEVNKALEAMTKLDEKIRKDLFKNLTGDPKKDGGRPGGTITARQERLLRWAMVFNTKDGRDYARQLGLLGAQIAVPEGTSAYRLYRDLRNLPAKGEIEDLSTMKSIYWIDDKPESVEGLCRALNIKAPPPPQVHFVAFFPLELEEKLAQMEMQHLQKTHPGKNLKDVDETRFEVRNNEPVITLMTMKGGR